MIQSDNSESYFMDIKKIIDKTRDFSINRMIELLGVLLILFSLFLLVSMFSYSPEDPNFIFNERNKINNLMGEKGSYASDFLFQSFGLVSYLVPLTYLFYLVKL